MSTIALNRSATGFSARLAVFVGNVAVRIARVAQAYRNRRDLQALAHADDRMLADIGLTRGDLRDAVAEPLWRDPSHILVMRAHERRLARRQATPVTLIDSPSVVPDRADIAIAIARTPARYY